MLYRREALPGYLKFVRRRFDQMPLDWFPEAYVGTVLKRGGTPPRLRELRPVLLRHLGANSTHADFL